MTDKQDKPADPDARNEWVTINHDHAKGGDTRILQLGKGCLVMCTVETPKPMMALVFIDDVAAIDPEDDPVSDDS